MKSSSFSLIKKINFLFLIADFITCLLPEKHVILLYDWFYPIKPQARADNKDGGYLEQGLPLYEERH